MLGLDEHKFGNIRIFLRKGSGLKTPPKEIFQTLSITNSRLRNTYKQWLAYNDIVASIILNDKVIISMNHAIALAPVQSHKGVVEFLLKYLPYYIHKPRIVTVDGIQYPGDPHYIDAKVKHINV